MDKIGDIIQIPAPGKSEEQSLSKVSPPTWQQEIVARYKTGEEILSLFNPSHQIRYTQNEQRCFTGHAPSIARVSRTFGVNIAESWLSIQLFDLAEFTQVRNGMETKDFIELARIIINGYGDFKLTEFMVFFQNFKKGQYGTFYGRFDPQTVTRSLRQFKAEREEILGKYADAKAAEERKREKQRWEQEKATPEQIEEIINKHTKKGDGMSYDMDMCDAMTHDNGYCPLREQCKRFILGQKALMEDYYPIYWIEPFYEDGKCELFIEVKED